MYTILLLTLFLKKDPVASGDDVHAAFNLIGEKRRSDRDGLPFMEMRNGQLWHTKGIYFDIGRKSFAGAIPDGITDFFCYLCRTAEHSNVASVCTFVREVTKAEMQPAVWLLSRNPLLLADAVHALQAEYRPVGCATVDLGKATTAMPVDESGFCTDVLHLWLLSTSSAQIDVRGVFKKRGLDVRSLLLDSSVNHSVRSSKSSLTLSVDEGTEMPARCAYIAHSATNLAQSYDRIYSAIP